jgi:hypothetical protein
MNLDSTSIALLLAEWPKLPEGYAGDTRCPICHGWAPHPRHGGGGHADGCVLDLALSERGFATQKDRDHARDLIRASEDDTIPPPT